MDLSRPTELVKSCAQSLVYSAVQSPYDGLSQLVNHVAGKEALPKLIFVDEPKAATAGSAEWHAQQIGAALGTVVDYVVATKLGGGATKRLGILKEAEEYSYKRDLLRITSPAITGAVMEGVFRPVRPEEGNFWAARGKNSLVGIYTYSALGLARGGIGSLAEKMRESGKIGVAAVLEKKVFAGALAGSVGGGVHAEIESLLDHGRLANGRDLKESVYRYAFAGALIMPLRGNAEGLKPFGAGLVPPSGPDNSPDRTRKYDDRWSQYPVSSDKLVVASHNELARDADSCIANRSERERFRANLDSFERRCTGQKVSSIEVAGTYDAIGKLLRSKTNLQISAERRVALAQQVLEQAAYPTRIDQGNHNTCGPASVEDRLYTRHPAAIAQLVETVSATGAYETKGHRLVKLTPLSLIPDFEAQSNIPEDARRSFASQLFEVTAANIAHQELDRSGVMRKWYTQNPVAADSKDTGERLYENYAAGGKKYLASKSPQFYDGSFQTIYSAVSGFDNSEYEITSGSLPSADSAGWLRKRLTKLKDDQQLPAYVCVYADKKLLNQSSSDNNSHAIDVTDYNAKTDKVSLDVHWGSEYATRQYSTGDLLDAMSPKKQLATGR